MSSLGVSYFGVCAMETLVRLFINLLFQTFSNKNDIALDKAYKNTTKTETQGNISFCYFTHELSRVVCF